MYPEVAHLVEWATRFTPDRPLIMCEYIHAMGNSCGGLDEYWAAIRAHRGLQGGFVWDWVDQALVQTLADGTERLAYGGDFGDEPNDGTFVCDGVTFPNRSPKPGLWELKQIASPLRVVSGADEARRGVVTLENRGFFRDTSWLRADWAVEVDGREISGGLLPLPSIPPGGRADAAIPRFRVPESDGPETRLTVRFRLAGATSWASEGFELGWAQVELGDGPPGLDGTGWTGDVELDETGQLRHPAFAAAPSLTLWRAPTDNDRIGGMAGRWADWGVGALTRRLDAIERGADETLVRSTWRTAPGIEVPFETRLARDAGGDVRVRERVKIPDALPDLARVGTVLTLAAGRERLTWLGTGPHETYPDRARSGRIGRWSSTVDEQLVPYVRPQENGGHAAVRWLEVAGDHGTDPAGVRIDLDEPRQVSVTHVRAADLASATHDVELRPRTETFVTIDAVHRGVGTASCGPDTLPQYLVPTGVHEWAYVLSAAEEA
jgi:beta-galactosidase